MVIESDLYSPRPLELLPHRSDRRAGEGRRSGRLQSSWQQGPHAGKNPARPGMHPLARVSCTSLGDDNTLRAAAAAAVSEHGLVICLTASQSSLATLLTPGEQSTYGVRSKLFPNTLSTRSEGTYSWA